ncbi:IS4 family transposase [Rubritalea tangerina]
MEANASCSKALSLIQSWYQAAGLQVPKGDTSGFCQARKRLQIDFIKTLSSQVSSQLEKRTQDCDLWNGLKLKAIDGSSVQLMDSEANQQVYPQPPTQKPGCGYPVMGFVGVVNLCHGGWEGFETCQWKKHDARVAPKLLKYVADGDLLMGDRAFCSYEIIGLTQQRGGHVLMRLHQARQRKLDWRKGRKVSPIERIVTWKKPSTQPEKSDLSSEQWDNLPSEMELRYIRVGFEDRSGLKRTLVVVTTLLDHIRYDAVELADLYAKRWEIEVKLRDVKTTMGLEKFAVKTPEMAHKTLIMMMLAYNLIRCLMQKSTTLTGISNSRLSFKGVLDVITSSQSYFMGLRARSRNLKACWTSLIGTCATKTLSIRPFRKEPRAQKQRPKNYQLLTESRHTFREISHRGAKRSAA